VTEAPAEPEAIIGPRPARVAVQALCKSYGPLRAVADVSFEIMAGEVFGLLGPNGAGKTTTVESIVGLLKPDAGAISICGLDPRGQSREVKQRIGVALQSTGLQDGITPREAIGSHAAFYRRTVQAAPLLQRFGLEAKADARVGTLSGGQRQRLALALAFVNDPEVVILDEPTVGLDPQIRRELHEQIRKMKREGRSVLLTTHDMDEASQLCDRIAVLNAGRIVALGAPADLVVRSCRVMKVRVRTGSPPMASWFSPGGMIQDLVCDVDGLAFTTRDLNAALPILAGVLGDHSVDVISLQADRGTLEDVILELIGPARDA
jgi:ABC-2 type transport system ATP-binding protein